MRKFWVTVPTLTEDEKVVFVRAGRFTFEDGALVFTSDSIKVAAFAAWYHVVEDDSE